VKDLARKSALTYKAKDNSIAIIENFNFEAPKTKEYLQMLKSLALGDKKTLLVLPESAKNVALSGKNVKNTKVITASQINTYDVLNAEHLILAEGSVEKISNLLIQA
jgi:large subunit ribosomal protein L4